MSRKDILALTKEYKNYYKNSERNYDKARVVMQGLKAVLLELLYPNTCILCGRFNKREVCYSCGVSYPVIVEPRCMCCGKPIESSEKEYCNDCMEGKKSFVQGRSLWVHKGNVKQSIYRFKYKNHRIYARTYARMLMEEQLGLVQEWKPEGILPIPIHSHRRRSRGYNQAEILAWAIQEYIEKELGVEIPLVTNVYRKKETTFQKKLDNRQRKKNLKHAFIIKENLKLPERILVIDDIYTTGATIQEMSNLLRESGAKQVFFLTISIGQGF